MKEGREDPARLSKPADPSRASAQAAIQTIETTTIGGASRGHSNTHNNNQRATMNIEAAYPILRNGDKYMVKNFIEENANGDPNLAASIVSSLRKELNKAKIVGIVLVILGIPFLLLFGLGIAFIGLGVWRFMQFRRGAKVLDEGYKLYTAMPENSRA